MKERRTKEHYDQDFLWNPDHTTDSLKQLSILPVAELRIQQMLSVTHFSSFIPVKGAGFA